MASPKALAAIALTLIVVIPICLGYAMASEPVQTTKWNTTETVSLSDTILNSQTPFYSEYADAMNNSTLLDYYGTTLVSPNYVSTSTTYSSIPVYNNGTGTVTLTSPTSGSSNLRSEHILIGVDSTVTPSITGLTGEIIQVSGNFSSVEVEGNAGNIDVTLSDGQQTLTFYKTTVTDYVLGMDGEYHAVTSPGYSWKYQNHTYLSAYFYVSSNISQYGDYVSGTYETLTVPHPVWVADFGASSKLIKLDYADGSDPTIYQSNSDFRLSCINDVVTVPGGTYNGVSSISIASLDTPNTITYTYRDPTGTYADPAYGWQLPSDHMDYGWTNTFNNNYVRMMVHFTSSNNMAFYPISNDGTYGTSVTIFYNSNGIRISHSGESYNLGFYDYLMIEIGTESTKITGLTSWPALGAMPQGYNSIELDPLITTNIEWIRINTYDSDNTNFRIDSANIIAGTFPSTKDFTLNLNDLFPGRSLKVKMNSVGIYGDSLTVAGTTYNVTNGRITADGASINVKGMTVSYLYNSASSSYDIYFNSAYIASSLSPTLYFGGEWSVTLTANIVEQVTETSPEWSPGGFAFDKDSFVGVIVLAAALTFIGVGMYGARSGVKAGLLLMICGGAALIAITTL